MAIEINRYLVPANGPEVEPIEAALDLLNEICKNLKNPKDAILLIPSEHTIQGTTLETALGTSIAKALLKGQPVGLPCGGNLKLETQQTFREFSTTDIIIGVYVNKKMLNQIDSATNAAAVIIVPWIMDDIREWKRTWNPHVLGESSVVSEELMDNPVVEEALKMLTNFVNLSTGLSHPRDKEATVQLFRELYGNNESYDADSIRAWALRNGWTPNGADQLRDIAQAILDRRPIRGGRGRYWKDNIIKMLRERAERSNRFNR